MLPACLSHHAESANVLLSQQATLLIRQCLGAGCSMYKLLAAADAALDATQRPLCDWALLRRGFMLSPRLTAAYQCGPFLSTRRPVISQTQLITSCRPAMQLFYLRNLFSMFHFVTTL